MSAKIERYINYVVNDLVKNTEINKDDREIKFPFLPSVAYIPRNTNLTFMGMFDWAMDNFYEYVAGMYGVKSDEFLKIMFSYTVLMEKELRNYGFIVFK